jgi:hypothetical protein
MRSFVACYALINLAFLVRQLGILIYNELPLNQFFIYVQICMSCSHHIIDNMPHLL